MNKVITISREFGSGGRTVGKLVAEKLNIPCYDQEIIQKIAQESGYCEDFIAEKSEHSSRKILIILILRTISAIPIKISCGLLN